MADPENQLKASIGVLNKQTKPLIRLDAYYEGLQPLCFVAPELFTELGDKVQPLVINWLRLGALAYEARLTLEGFRLPGAVDSDQDLWEIWQDNDLDELAPQAHLEALALGRSYVIVGPGAEDGDNPLITVEHPLEVIATTDPRTRKVSSAVKRWKDDEGTTRATLYLPDETRHYRRSRGWVEDESERDEHNWGVVPVVPMVNRGRMLRPLGVSEFQDVIPLADAVNKMATDMMISAEFHAMPRRWVFGMKESDFQDENGKALSVWSTIAGRLWATSTKPSDVAAGQFPEADLSNFHNSIKLLAQLASQLLALPPDWLSFAGVNPTSADAIRAGEAQLVRRCEQKQVIFGAGWERVMRIALIIAKKKELAEKARRLETVWRDASTPTTAQLADAVTKLSGGVPILPRQGAWDVLGYSGPRKERLAKQFREQTAEEFGSLQEPPPEPVPV